MLAHKDRIDVFPEPFLCAGLRHQLHPITSIRNFLLRVQVLVQDDDFEASGDEYLTGRREDVGKSAEAEAKIHTVVHRVRNLVVG